MRGMTNPVMPGKQPMRIEIDNSYYSDVQDLQLNDEIEIKAIGIVKKVSEDRDYQSKTGEPKVYSCSVELKDINITPISSDDRKEAESMGTNLPGYLKAKKAKEKAFAARNKE